MRASARFFASLAAIGLALVGVSCALPPTTRPAIHARPPKILHVLATHVEPSAEADAPLSITVYANGANRLEDLVDPANVVAGTDDHVTLALPDGEIDLSEIGGDPDDYRTSTFVIDWETPEVGEWADEIVARFGESPSLEQIREAVASSIEADGSRAFDIASQVARNRVGDCTEHAVAFAALARRFDHPARVIMGVVVARDDEGRMGSFGHAWAEVATPTGWELVDATNIEGAVPIAYLPTGWLSREGPGYSRAVADYVIVERVEIVAPDSD